VNSKFQKKKIANIQQKFFFAKVRDFFSKKIDIFSAKFSDFFFNI